VRDERVVVGFVVLQLVLAGTGVAVLDALGLVRPGPAGLLAALGAGLLTGVAALGLPLIVLLVLGGRVTTAVALIAVAVLTALALGVAHRRRRRAPELRRAPRLGTRARVGGAVLVAAVGAYFALGCLALIHVPTAWDDANIWSRGGLALYHYGGLTPDVFRNPYLSFVHLDYPLLQPLLEASFFRAIGRVDVRLWHVQLWVVFAAVVWTLAWLLAARARNLWWTAAIVVLAAAPVVTANVTLGDADATVAGFLACGALAFGLWVERAERPLALLGAVFLAAAANTKNEGLAFGAAAIASLALVTAVRPEPGRWRDLGIACALGAALVMPWQLWVAANPTATHGTLAPWAASLPDLIDRVAFLGRGVDQVVYQLVRPTAWGVLVPAFVLLALALLVSGAGRGRAVATYYLGAAAFGALAVVYMYWATPLADLAGFEQRTGPRVVLGVAFVAGAGLAHLLQLATAPAAEPDYSDRNVSRSALKRAGRSSMATWPVSS
jgi:hypothetical protein